MRTAFSLALSLVALTFLVLGLKAEDKKEVTLKGEIMCAKCELKEAKKK